MYTYIYIYIYIYISYIHIYIERERESDRFGQVQALREPAIRPISLLRISLLRFVDSRLPGNILIIKYLYYY